MKLAVQEAIREVQDDIEAIQNKVREKAMGIAERTQQALLDIDRGLASQLTPNFPLLHLPSGQDCLV